MVAHDEAERPSNHSIEPEPKKLLFVEILGSGSLLVIPLACYPSIDRSFYRNKSTFVEGCDQAYERADSVGLAEWIGRDRD